MKKLFPLVIALCLMPYALCLSSCHCKKKTPAENNTVTEVKRDFEKEGYVPAIVIFSDMDACKFLLVLANEKRLEPSAHLPEAFHEHQLAVWVKYMDKKGGMSACMAGQLVDISDIQIRK